MESLEYFAKRLRVNPRASIAHRKLDMLGALCNDRAHRSARRCEFDGIR
jgi:hypothetical protein